MVRVITQETYDEVVNENIEQFGMSPEEAIEDAINQFKAQGIDLSNIIKDVIINSDNTVMLSYLNDINLAMQNNSYERVPNILDKLRDELEKDIAHRIFVARNGGYKLLIKLMKECKSNTAIIKSALNAITTLMIGYPDLLDDAGVSLQIELLDKQQDIQILQCTLRWIRECCIKHEINRQTIFRANIFDKLKKILTRDGATGPELQDACAVLRALVLDDDIRHEFGKAHEHATVIAKGALDVLTGLLSRFKSDKTVAGDLMITLAALIVRNEFCQAAADAGGLKFVLDVMTDYPDSEKLNWQALKLLQALAGNDDVKSQIITSGSAPLIVSAISRMKSSELVLTAGLACISTLSLRNSSNAGVFYDCGAASVIIDAMKSYPKSKNVLKHAAWAIRNMSVRNKAECKEFIQYGVEDVLRSALQTHRHELEYDIMSALRDLGLKVEMKERWSGKGVHLSN